MPAVSANDHIQTLNEIFALQDYAQSVRRLDKFVDSLSDADITAILSELPFALDDRYRMLDLFETLVNRNQPVSPEVASAMFEAAEQEGDYLLQTDCIIRTLAYLPNQTRLKAVDVLWKTFQQNTHDQGFIGLNLPNMIPHASADMMLELLNFSEQFTHGTDKVSCYLALSEIAGDPEEKADMLYRAIRQAREVLDQEPRFRAFTALLPFVEGQVKEEALGEAETAAADISDPQSRAYAWFDFAEVVPENKRETCYQKSLESVEQISRDEEKADVLIEMTRTGPAALSEKINQIAQQLVSQDAKTRLLTYLQQLSRQPVTENVTPADDDSVSVTAAQPEKAVQSTGDAQQSASKKTTPEPDTSPEEGESDQQESKSEVPPSYAKSDRSVPNHPDDPANIDELNRKPLAEVVAASIHDVWAERAEQNAHKPKRLRDTGSYMVHLHGPWGSGKSSILNFLRDILKGGSLGTKYNTPPPVHWIVVDFNAWQHQGTGPPWWAFLNALFRQSARQLWEAGAWLKWLKFNIREGIWQLRMGMGAHLIVLAVILWIALFLFGSSSPKPETARAPTVVTEAKKSPEKTSGINAKTTAEIIAALLTISGLLLGGVRSLFHGGGQNAEFYTKIRRDPMQPIVRHFKGLVKQTGRPVAIFIDDLDRCRSSYVVELLQGIQTLFREGNVTYVVAADLDWLRSSYEQAYPEFKDNISEPGKPLGYMFVEKIFQISLPVPNVSGTDKERYLKLLATASQEEEQTGDDEQEQQNAQEALKDIFDVEQLQEEIKKVSHSPRRQHAFRVVAAKKSITTEGQQFNKHFLESYSHFIQGNPREMKRLVNAYGFQQAVNLLSGNNVDPDKLARWTILRMNWPLLADYLTRYPQKLDQQSLHYAMSEDERINALLGNDEVHAVIKGDYAGRALTAEDIRTLTG